MIPLRDNVPASRFPIVTVSIIILNVLAFLYELKQGSQTEYFIMDYGIVPVRYTNHDVASQFTVVDVFTQDRLGVLYAITRTLARLGLDVALSKVATEADRVADVFYVRDETTGAKIVEPARLAAIKDALRAALAEI